MKLKSNQIGNCFYYIW